MVDDKELKKTPLYETHKKSGARMVEFGGWLMPVQYSGIKEEHLAVRSSAGIFDVSHMGEFEVSGSDALAFLQYLTPNDVSRIAVGCAQYNALLNDKAGIIDDIFVYRLEDNRYLLCVNASNTEKDWSWLKENAPKFRVELENISAKTALLAVQGPKSSAIVEKVAGKGIAQIKRLGVTSGEISGAKAIFARTGYTGEDGFEIFFDASKAEEVWEILLEAGKEHNLVPAGLGARDTLRLEMGYPLHGNDIDEEHTPFESNIGWICKLDKGDFVGRDVLIKQKSEGVKEKLTGAVLSDKGVPRHGYEVLSPTGEKIGIVTSGTMSPSLGEGIALVRLRPDYADEGREIYIQVRDKKRKAVTKKPPFYKR